MLAALFWMTSATVLAAPDLTGARDPDTGTYTHLSPTMSGGRVDFGEVSNLGPAPTNGRRVLTPEGAFYVSSMLWRPPLAAGCDGAYRSVGVSRRTPRGSRRAPVTVPHCLEPEGTYDLIGSVSLPPTTDDVQVWMAIGGQVDWSAPELSAVQLTGADTMLAMDQPVGEPVLVEVALFAPDTAMGPAVAEVRLNARPSSVWDDVAVPSARVRPLKARATASGGVTGSPRRADPR